MAKAEAVEAMREAIEQVLANGPRTESMNLCATFEIAGRDSVWAQVMSEQVNLSYPRTDDPHGALADTELLAAPIVGLQLWESELFVTLGHGSCDARVLTDFVLRYWQAFYPGEWDDLSLDVAIEDLASGVEAEQEDDPLPAADMEGASEITSRVVGDDAVVIARDLLGPEASSAGLPEAELRAAEHRLDLRLPAPLRRYYAERGAFDRFNRAFDELYPPAELEIDRDMLLFLESHQGVSYYGFRVAEITQADPEVHVCFHEDEGWQLDGLRCEAFLVMFVYMQYTSSSIAIVGDHDDVSVLLTSLGTEWHEVVCHGGMTIYRYGPALINVLDGDEFCIGAAPDEDAFGAYLEPLGFVRH